MSSRATSSGSVASSLCLDSSAHVLQNRASRRFNGRCNPLTLRRPDPRRITTNTTAAGQSIGSKRERSSSGSSSNGGNVDFSRMEEQNPNTACRDKRLRLLPTTSSTLRRNISSGASTLSRLIGNPKNATFSDFRSHQHHHSASRFGGGLYSASSSSAMMNSSFGVLSLKRPRSLHGSVHGAAGVGGVVGCMKNSSFSK